MTVIRIGRELSFPERLETVLVAEESLPPMDSDGHMVSGRTLRVGTLISRSFAKEHDDVIHAIGESIGIRSDRDYFESVNHLNNET